MKKEEILMKYLNVDPSRTNEILLRECIHRAMDEYGEFCYNMGKQDLFYAIDDFYTFRKYADFLNELEDEK